MKSNETEEAIEAAAAEWLARRDRKFTAEEAVAFARWRLSDSRHAAAVADLEAVWGALDGLAAGHRQPGAGGAMVAPLAPTPVAPGEPAESRRRVGGRWFSPAWGLAAAMVIAALGVWWGKGRETAAPVLRYETIVGERRIVALPDGSEMQLNTFTGVRVHYGRARRGVELDHGEAFFRVTPDPTRPFVVTVAGAEARALGTAFLVRLRDDRNDQEMAEVLVTEGRVQFGRQGAADPTLTRGQLGTLARGGRGVVRIETLSETALRARLAWQSGRAEFSDTPLSEVVSELNRYHRRQVVLGDAALAEFRIGGGFEIANQDGFLRALEAMMPVRVVRKDQDTLVLAPRR